MKTALITGGAARIGAQIARTLHENNFKIIIHCNQSLKKAQLLSDELNSVIKDSSGVISGNLNNIESISSIVNSIDSLDLLVNNASVFYPKSVDNSEIDEDRPLKNHAVYNISKAGLKMMTQTLAKELAPNIRVNGVSPGSILWPEASAEISEAEKKLMLERIALNRQGSPQDIADTVLFLANSDYITGQIINIDGGRTLNQ